MQVVANQPVVVAIEAMSMDLMNYRIRDYENGIFTGQCSSDLGSSTNLHAVVLMGYTETYWILRNSWGSKWGDYYPTTTCHVARTNVALPSKLTCLQSLS
jgi:KDEL-tailed cysteine endopeptidase